MLIENGVNVIQRKLFNGFGGNVICREFYFYPGYNLFHFMADNIPCKFKNKCFKARMGQKVAAIMHFSIMRLIHIVYENIGNEIKSSSTSQFQNVFNFLTLVNSVLAL